jgi:UDP-N-acetyl-D-glucosamine dehydrogenase
VETAGRINDAMPGFVVDKLERALEARGARRAGRPRVLAVGVTYKPDVADLRESAALRVLERLIERGFDVSYHDPLVQQLEIGEGLLHSQPLQSAGGVDAVVLLTPHSTIDYAGLLDRAALVLDTTNALRNGPHGQAQVVPL